MKSKAILLLAIAASIAPVTSWARTEFTPGKSWSDTRGTHINAHGGCVVFHEGTYYWFGEDRTGYTSNGISCYTSTNLYDWTRQGLVFRADQAYDPETGACILERPKVVYNAHTDKWVMYIHWENGLGYGEARVCVAYADKVNGEYTFSSTFRPNEHDSRDQTVIVGPQGEGYHFCATGMNTDINIALLSEDFLTTEQNPVTEIQILRGRRLEAPAALRVDDTYFCVFSECSGWDPNPGHCAFSTDIMGEWTEGPNFAIDNGAATTYQSQSTYIITVDGRPNAYIYMGDRWDKNDVGGRSEYVWLPLSVRSGFPTVKWYDSWNLSVFDDADRFKRIAALADGAEVRILDKYSDRWVSTKGNGYYIDDDNDAVNVDFRLEATDNPYIWHIIDVESGLYLESIFGSIRLGQRNEGSDTQDWRFELLEDGCYKIQSCQSDKVLTVAGSSQTVGSTIFMTTDGSTRSQAFGLYFDSKAHDYEAARMFSKEYIAHNIAAIEEQRDYENQAGISTVTAGGKVTLTYDGLSLHVATNGMSGIARISVVEAAGGRTVYQTACDTDATGASVMLPDLAQGIYVASVDIDGRSATLKFAK